MRLFLLITTHSPTHLRTVVDPRHARRSLGLNEQRLSLAVLDARLAVLSQLLDPALDPSLPSLDLSRLSFEHNIAAGRTRRAVIDLQTRRHADLVRQSRETRPRESLVQQRSEQPAVHDRRVPAQRLAEERDLHETRQLFARVRQAERWDFDLARSEQHAACEVVRTHGFGDFEVGPRLDDALLCAQAGGERVRGDVLVDRGGFGGGWLEHCEGFEVGGWVEDAVDGVGGGGGGHDEAGCEEDEDEGGGYEGVSESTGFWWGVCCC